MTRPLSPAEQNISYEFTKWRNENALALQTMTTDARNSAFKMKLHELAANHGLWSVE